MKVLIVACLTLLLLFTAIKANAEPTAVPAPTPTPNPANAPQNTDPKKDPTAKAGSGEEKKPEKVITDGYVPEPVAPGRDLALHGNFKDAGQWLLTLTKVD